jgi:hypothetical protein
MRYSLEKTSGFSEKLTRLARHPDDLQSVFGFMDTYWHRFQIFDDALATTAEPLLAQHALQLYGKVVAGLCDKVALSLWLHDVTHHAADDPGQAVDTALPLVQAHATELDGTATNHGEYTRQPFAANPMGSAILAMHESYAREPSDAESLFLITLGGSAEGVLMWGAYAHTIAARGLSAALPRPGEPSGSLLPWKN